LFLCLEFYSKIKMDRSGYFINNSNRPAVYWLGLQANRIIRRLVDNNSIQTPIQTLSNPLQTCWQCVQALYQRQVQVTAKSVKPKPLWTLIVKTNCEIKCLDSCWLSLWARYLYQIWYVEIKYCIVIQTVLIWPNSNRGTI